MRRQFQNDLAAGDADAALAACLELDDAMAAWAADTLQNDDIDHARRALRAMLVDLAEAAKNGLRDERGVALPVEVMDDLELKIMDLARARFPG